MRESRFEKRELLLLLVGWLAASGRSIGVYYTCRDKWAIDPASRNSRIGRATRRSSFCSTREEIPKESPAAPMLLLLLTRRALKVGRTYSIGILGAPIFIESAMTRETPCARTSTIVLSQRQLH